MKTHYFYLNCLITTIALTANATNNLKSGNGSLCFRENKGQVSDQNYKPRPDILFSGTDGQLVFHLKQDGISYQFSKVKSWTQPNKLFGNSLLNKGEAKPEPKELSIERLDIKWLNSNSNSKVEKHNIVEGYDNFYSETCPNGALEVLSYKEILYRSLYHGIDLKWYEKNGQLKYDYLLSSGADYTQIKLEINGAKSISISAEGKLVIKTTLSHLMEDLPLVVQDGKQLRANWKVEGNIVSFQIENVNPYKSFTIDPLVRLWGTYFGGTSLDNNSYHCVDNFNNVYLAGQTRSPSHINIATVGAFQTTYGGAGFGSFPGDAFIAKYNSNGVRQWSTYYGGSGCDFANNCVADANGNVYFGGASNTTNTNVICTPGCYQSFFAGGSSIGDPIIVKLNSAGARIWATYYGDSSEDWILGTCIDTGGDLYVCGGTWKANGNVFASPGCHQAAHGGVGNDLDGFIAKFSPTGNRIWGTYYGSTAYDNTHYCTTDLQNNVFIVGATSNTNSPAVVTLGCFQSTNAGTPNTYEGLLIKFNSLGVRQWATFYGGSGDELIANCETDKFGNVYIAGQTSSPTTTNLTTPGCFQPSFGGGLWDCFFAKFDSAGLRQWASYYGGTGDDYGGYWAVDVLNNFYLSGATSTSSGTAIITPCTYQSVFGGGTHDAFLAKFDSLGSRLWGTYYGGAGNEDSWVTAETDGHANVYMSGITTAASNSLVIASQGASQPVYGGGSSDIFLVKFNGCIPVAPPQLTKLTICKGKTSALNTTPICGVRWYSDSTLTNLVFTGGSFTTGVINNDTTFYYTDFSCGQVSAKTVANLTVVPVPTVNVVVNPQIICAGETATLIPSGANTYTWVNAPGSGSIVVSPSTTTIYTVTGISLNGCSSTTVNFVNLMDCTGIKESKENGGNTLIVYPNPANGYIIIETKSEMKITLLNELGIVIKDLGKVGAGSLKLELNNIPAGIYLLVLRNESSKVIKKLAVER